MSWRLLGRFVLTKNWQYTALTNYQIFRIKNNFIFNKNNQYLKGAISSIYMDGNRVNLFDSRRLSWRSEPEIFVFDFPKALKSQRIGLRRLDDTKLIWTVDIEVLEVEMSNIELSISGLSITDIEGLQTALNSKANVDDVASSAEVEAALGNIIQMIPVTSEQEPINTFVGMVWNEIDSNGNLLESWIRQANNWISQTKYSLDYWSGTSSISGNVSYRLPLNVAYNYLFKEFSYHCLYSSGTVDENNYWRALFTTQPSGNTFADSGAIPSNPNTSITTPLNVMFEPSNDGEIVFAMFQKTGTAPSVRIGASVKYHRVRK